MAGGFLPDGYEEEEEEKEAPAHHTSSFFPAIDEDDDGDDGLVMEHDGADQQRAMIPMEVDEEVPSKLDAEAGLDPEPQVKSESETPERGVAPEDEDEDEEPKPEPETQSEAESEPPRTTSRSRKRAPAKQIKKEKQPLVRATRRSTRSGRNIVSYDEDVGGNDDEIGDSYAESEDDE